MLVSAWYGMIDHHHHHILVPIRLGRYLQSDSSSVRKEWSCYLDDVYDGEHCDVGDSACQSCLPDHLRHLVQDLN